MTSSRVISFYFPYIKCPIHMNQMIKHWAKTKTIMKKKHKLSCDSLDAAFCQIAILSTKKNLVGCSELIFSNYIFGTGSFN